MPVREPRGRMPSLGIAGPGTTAATASRQFPGILLPLQGNLAAIKRCSCLPRIVVGGMCKPGLAAVCCNQQPAGVAGTGRTSWLRRPRMAGYRPGMTPGSRLLEPQTVRRRRGLRREGEGTTAGARLLRGRVARPLHAWRHQGAAEAGARLDALSVGARPAAPADRDIRIAERARRARARYRGSLFLAPQADRQGPGPARHRRQRGRRLGGRHQRHHAGARAGPRPVDRPHAQDVARGGGRAASAGAGAAGQAVEQGAALSRSVGAVPPAHPGAGDGSRNSQPAVDVLPLALVRAAVRRRPLPRRCCTTP